MKRLLLPGLAAALCGAAAGSPALAWGPCSQPGCVLPYRLERKLVTGYRTETRTEIRLVPRTVYRTVPETVTEVVEEQVLVPFWREEERSRDVMVIEHKEEKRPCKALIVGEEEEKRTRTLMVPAKQEETRQALTYDLRTVPELKKHVLAAPIVLPPCGCAGALDAIAAQLAPACVTREFVYHLVPELREVPYKVTTETFNGKEETYTTTVPTFKEAPPVTVPVVEYTPRAEKCKVRVLDFREETRKHEVKVTVYRRKAETVMEEAPCTVEVQVPYQKEVWVPVCPLPTK